METYQCAQDYATYSIKNVTLSVIITDSLKSTDGDSIEVVTLTVSEATRVYIKQKRISAIIMQ